MFKFVYNNAGSLWAASVIAVILFVCFGFVTASCEQPNHDGVCLTANGLEAVKKEAYAAGYQKAKADEAEYPVRLKLFSKAQLLQFLKQNECNLVTDDRVPCVSRASCLIRAAREAGYDAGGVYIKLAQPPDHFIAFFPTTDAGTVYVEVQYDSLAILKVGENYGAQFGLKEKVVPVGVFYIP